MAAGVHAKRCAGSRLSQKPEGSASYLAGCDYVLTRARERIRRGAQAAGGVNKDVERGEHLWTRCVLGASSRSNPRTCATARSSVRRASTWDSAWDSLPRCGSVIQPGCSLQHHAPHRATGSATCAVISAILRFRPHATYSFGCALRASATSPRGLRSLLRVRSAVKTILLSSLKGIASSVANTSCASSVPVLSAAPTADLRPPARRHAHPRRARASGPEPPRRRRRASPKSRPSSGESSLSASGRAALAASSVMARGLATSPATDVGAERKTPTP
eukprot:scaffold149530_cov31-Tisochrysis_lutea.AAC.2